MLRKPLPLLSVIIPTLNEAGHLPGLLGDLMRQQDIDVEVIVADGGSTDATRSAAEAHGALFVNAGRGRGLQMNAGAEQASGEVFLFLHADSSIDDPSLLSAAVRALLSEPGDPDRTAGHFRLHFRRCTGRNAMAYRYAEEKSALNKDSTTNGDQGLLLAKVFFRHLGGFDESMPFLEDQRIAAKIRDQGRLITLPGCLGTSARRFEVEGFHRRYILMSMMMGMHAIGESSFFTRAPGVYRVQQETGRLLLSPFFGIIRTMMREEWGLWGSIRVFYRLGRYIRGNSWQLFYFFDVWARPLLGAGRYPCLRFHDRFIALLTDLWIFNALVGLLCFVWFMVILSLYFRYTDRNGLHAAPA